MKQRGVSALGLVVGFCALACGDAGNSPQIFGTSPTLPNTVAQAGGGGVSNFEPPLIGGSGGGGSLVRVIPTDERPAVSAAAPPPAISGGTLGTTADGAFVVVADSDRDRIVLVNVATRQIAREIVLEAGDEPGRVVAGPGQQVFVALRRGGAVVTVDPTLGLVARRSTCLAPRGLAYDAVGDQLHVACADGKLVTFTGTAEVPSRVLSLDNDLRDVVLVGSRVMISRLRSAELLEVAADGSVVQRIKPEHLLGTVPAPSADVAQAPAVDPGTTATVANAIALFPTSEPELVGTTVSALFAPAVAWRTVQGADGSVHMLHQRGQQGEIRTSHEGDDDMFANPYGSGNPCSGIVRNGVSKMGADNQFHAEVAPSVPLPVDMAISANGRYIAVASAGMTDFEAPQPTFEFVGDPSVGAAGVAAGGAPGGFSGIQVIMVPTMSEVDPSGVPVATAPVTSDPAAGGTGSVGTGSVGTGGGTATAPTEPSLPPPMAASPSADNCDFDAVGTFIQEPVVAVAFGPTDSAVLFAQTRSPSQLYFVDLVSGLADPVQLGGVSVADTAHDLFHRSAGAGIACASCHPEGSDDGRVWNFEGFGQRRTQALDIGLQGTEPFHWDGELASVGALMDEVFVGRMGGVKESPERLAVLESWIFGLKPLPARRAATDALAVRGQVLFNSAAVGCSTCHSGPAFTNNLSYPVGTTENGEPLQVPGLLGISYRSPLMHNGCAATLAGRFDPACGGGDLHGVTSALPPEDISALVAYLETL